MTHRFSVVAGLGDRSDLTGINAVLDTAAKRRYRLDLGDIEVLARRSLAGSRMTAARLYLAMLSDAPDDEALEDACVEALAGSLHWNDLLTEALTNLPLTSAVSRVIVRAIGRLMPDNPVSSLSHHSNLNIIRAYDAVDDGEQIRIDLLSTDHITDDFKGCLLGIEKPATHFATCEIASLTPDAIILSVDRSGPLFEEGRHVLPPSVLIVAKG